MVQLLKRWNRTRDEASEPIERGNLLAEVEKRRIAARVERRAADGDAAVERAVEGKQAGGFVERLTVKVPLVRSAARPRPGHKVGVPIGIEVGAGNTDAAGKRSVVGQKTRERRAIGSVEHFHVRSAAGPGAGDDVGVAVIIEIAGSDIDTAGKCAVVRQKAGHGRAVCRERFHVRPAASARRR